MAGKAGTTNYPEEKKILEQIDRVGELLDAEQQRTDAAVKAQQ